jgi:hypothetical protein
MTLRECQRLQKCQSQAKKLKKGISHRENRFHRLSPQTLVTESQQMWCKPTIEIVRPCLNETVIRKKGGERTLDRQ